MTILAAIQGVQDIVGAVTGIRSAPDYAPDSAHVLPIAIAWPSDGEFKFGPGYRGKTGLHSIIVEIHLPRTDLPKAIQASIGYIETVTDALLKDPTLKGGAQTFERIDYTYGPMAWGDGANLIQTFGPRFTLRGVKIVNAIS